MARYVPTGRVDHGTSIRTTRHYVSGNEWTMLRAAGMNAGDSAQGCVARQQNHTKHGEEQYGSPFHDFLRGERSTFQSGKALLGASTGLSLIHI